MECVAGLDPSLTSFGVAVIASEGRVVTDVVGSRHRGLEVRQRIARYEEIVERVMGILDIWKPGAVALEHYAFRALLTGDDAMQRGHIDRIELGGLLRSDLCACVYVKQLYEVAPATVKKFVYRGNAGKEDVRRAVELQWDLRFGTHDETDAYVLARLAGVASGMLVAENDQQRECCRVVRGK